MFRIRMAAIKIRICSIGLIAALVAIQILLLSSYVSAHAQTTREKVTTLSWPDKSIGLKLPDGWVVEVVGARRAITSPEKEHYFLVFDAFTSTGDLTSSSDLRLRFDKLADDLLEEIQFVSSKSVDIGVGDLAASVFRYKEKGKTGDAADITDFWAARYRNHSLLVLPENGGQEDVSAAVVAILKSIGPTTVIQASESASSAAQAPVPPPATIPDKPTANTPERDTDTAKPTGAASAAPSKSPKRAAVAKSNLLEGYTGKLFASDLTFRLNLNKDGSASATWTTSRGTTEYAGKYSGQSGTYSVDLTSEKLDGSADTMKLILRPQGAVEIGTFNLNGGTRNSVLHLELLELGGDDSDTSGSKGGGGRGGRRGGRRGQ